MKFKIAFDPNDKAKLFKYWDEIIENNKWSEGKFIKKFEEKWTTYNSIETISFSSWSGAAEAALKYFKLENEVVLCPSNTYQATPMLSKLNGADVKFAESDAEKALFSALDVADAQIKPAMDAQDFSTAMAALSILRGPIDMFFDSVKINADSAMIRRNRLNLLSRIRTTCLSVADLSKLEG